MKKVILLMLAFSSLGYADCRKDNLHDPTKYALIVEKVSRLAIKAVNCTTVKENLKEIPNFSDTMGPGSSSTFYIKDRLGLYIHVENLKNSRENITSISYCDKTTGKYVFAVLDGQSEQQSYQGGGLKEEDICK